MRYTFTACSMALLIGCAPQKTIPTDAQVGPPPAAPEVSVNQWLQATLKDPDSVKALRIGPPRKGGWWTGVQNQGLVPKWYVCASFNAKNSFGAYAGASNYALFFTGETVTNSYEGLTDDWHNFDCQGI